jgi:hypothetical protein
LLYPAIPPPAPWLLVPSTVLSVSVTVLPMIPAPSPVALLPLTVQSVSVTSPPAIPPPLANTREPPRGLDVGT